MFNEIIWSRTELKNTSIERVSTALLSALESLLIAMTMLTGSFTFVQNAQSSSINSLLRTKSTANESRIR